MRLAGYQGTSLIDYPGRVAATLFAAGCNFRCPFCHNAELVLPERVATLARLDPDEVLCDLERRRDFVDGVVLTGGEPTLQEDLAAFAERVRALGFLVKLDTNGSRPRVVRALLDRGLLDYVAVDVKAPPARYSEFAGDEARPADVEETVRAIRESELEYELRTTVAPGLTAGDIAAIAEWIGPAKRYVLQLFRVPTGKADGLLDPSWAERTSLGERELRKAWAAVRDRFDDGAVRA
jgi:pyruvate formate lyase activating enzyme